MIFHPPEFLAASLGNVKVVEPIRSGYGRSDEIGLNYMLRRESHGQGIAMEATRTLLQFAFEVEKLVRVMAMVMAENTASNRVLQKLGMQFVEAAESRDGMRLEYFQIEAHTSAADRSESNSAKEEAP
jgi:ribosomal-protein-alanine N-acetyltransferase